MTPSIPMSMVRNRHKKVPTFGFVFLLLLLNLKVTFSIERWLPPLRKHVELGKAEASQTRCKGLDQEDRKLDSCAVSRYRICYCLCLGILLSMYVLRSISLCFDSRLLIFNWQLSRNMEVSFAQSIASSTALSPSSFLSAGCSFRRRSCAIM